MTRKVTFRQSDTERAIRAAKRAGLRIIAVRSDGTIITGQPGDPPIMPELVSVAPRRKIALL